MRAWPKGLIGALAIIVAIEALTERTHLWFTDEATTMWQEKVRVAELERQAPELLILGSSRFMHGLMPNEMTAQISPAPSAYSYALSGMHPMGFLILLERHLAHHAPPKTVLLEFSPNHLNYDVDATYASPYLSVLYNRRDLWRSLHWDPDATIAAEWFSYRLLPTARYRQGLDNFASRTLIERRPPTEYHDRNLTIQKQFADLNGYRPWKTNPLPDEWKPKRENLTAAAFQPRPAMTDAFNQILQVCAKHKIKCAIIPAPLPNESVQHRRDTGYEAAFMNWLTQTIASQNFVTIHPIVAMPHHFFCDPTHLNPTGAKTFSQNLGQWLNRNAADLGLANTSPNPLIANAR